MDTDVDLRFDARDMAKCMLAWFDRVRRDMPWRRTRDPYAIWVSETMLQQTQVATVVPYYRRFLERFPTVASLAAAPLGDVLALWAGLGYYRRAKHLRLAAQEVVARHGGRVPGTVEELLALPGIGRYTAGAVGSIAFNLPAPVVDGNVMRVLARVYGYDRDIAQAKNHAFFWEKAGKIVRAATQSAGRGKAESRRYGDFNQALMELGATVCLPAPAMPPCARCPLRRFCRACDEGRQMELPVKSAKKAVPAVRQKALVILRRHRGRVEVLLMERPAGGLWEHMWEFPALAADEKDVAAALGVTLRHAWPCGVVKHQLTHRMMVYEVIAARTRQTPAVMPRCDGGKRYVAARWVAWPLDKVQELPMAKVAHKIAAAAQTFNS
jgi:A/G-specific adenine glycosylase